MITTCKLGFRNSSFLIWTVLTFGFWLNCIHLQTFLSVFTLFYKIKYDLKVFTCHHTFLRFLKVFNLKINFVIHITYKPKKKFQLFNRFLHFFTNFYSFFEFLRNFYIFRYFYLQISTKVFEFLRISIIILRHFYFLAETKMKTCLHAVFL